MNAFLAELRRRNVFRVAAAYLVVGWLILQVIALIEAPLALPAWTDTLVIVLLGVGLPVALIFAWAFEMTPEGVKRTVDVDPEASISDKTARRLDYGVLAALVLLVGLIGWQQITRPDTPAPAHPAAEVASDATPGSNTIAVLPFADLSAAGDQEYFADGIAEEILNVLAALDALDVTSRTSAFAFKSQSELSIPAIAEALGVRHVLEGSVRTAGGTIRVTAQLIDAEGDQHLWSETWDRELTAENVFAIQDEIAAAITTELAARLGVEIERPEAARTTTEISAYEAFLRGRELFLDRNYTKLPLAVQSLERAVEIDPNFTEARAALALAYAVSPGWAFLDRDYAGLARDAANMVLAVQPDNSMALTALAQEARIASPPDWNRAADAYDRAVESDPRNPTARLWRAQMLRDLGFFEAADADLRACIEMEPLYGVCLYNYAANLINLDREHEAFEALVPIMGTAHAESYPEFLGLAASRGDRLLLGYMLRETADVMDADVRWIVPELMRALSTEAYDREAALERFRQRLRSEGYDLDTDNYIAGSIYLAFGFYERIPVDRSPAGWFWFRGYPGLAGSDAQADMIRALGIDDYWREHGFPPQCRPVGGDDFVCD